MVKTVGKLVLPLLLLAMATLASPWRQARAIELPDLYKGQAIVTGTQEPERSRGMRLALMDVLVKVSGDARLLDDKTLQPVLDHAKDYAIAFDYEDRKKGLKINDEQGTRDRPFDLRVLFDKAKIDALLAERSLKPWSAERPQLLALVVVRFPANSYVMTADGQAGYAQRLALDAASTRRGLPVVLPSAELLGKNGLDAKLLATFAPGDLTKLAKLAQADMPLRGVMLWDDKMPGWRTDWTLIENGHEHRWQDDSPSFDEAFRKVVQHGAAIFAGLRE